MKAAMPGSIPFDGLAGTYAAQWSDSEEGSAQRAEVWSHIDPLFRAGQHVLDLGCGIGNDALHLVTRGVQVFGIDASIEMVARAQVNGVRAQHLWIEELGSLDAPYDGVLSNFGALNCVDDVGGVARQLTRLIRPGGTLAICVMSRFCLRESLRFFANGNIRLATRRWSGTADWRGITIYYRSRYEIARLFAPHFHCTRRASIGRGDHQLYIFQRGAR